eukprot:3815239-Prymnesium_polylepis.1
MMILRAAQAGKCTNVATSQVGSVNDLRRPVVHDRCDGPRARVPLGARTRCELISDARRRGTAAGAVSVLSLLTASGPHESRCGLCAVGSAGCESSVGCVVPSPARASRVRGPPSREHGRCARRTPRR